MTFKIECASADTFVTTVRQLMYQEVSFVSNVDDFGYYTVWLLERPKDESIAKIAA